LSEGTEQKPRKTHNQDKWSLGQNFNPVPLNWEVWVLVIGDDLLSNDDVIMNGELEMLC